MGDDVRRASIGLILLFLVGTIHRYATFSNGSNISQMLTGNTVPLELASLTEGGAPPAVPASNPFSEEVEKQRNRIAMLQNQNKELRDQQEKMLNVVSNPSSFAPPSSSQQVAAPVTRMAAAAQSVVPPTKLVSSQEAGGWSGGLRGTGLGDIASAALAKATMVVEAVEAPLVSYQSDQPQTASSMVGSVVTFQSPRTRQFLTLDDKGWIVPDVDGSSALASRSFRVEDVGGGWVGLRCLTGTSMYLEMVPRSQPLAWVVRAVHGQSGSLSVKQQWRLEDGRLFNRESEAFVNMIGNAVRGHGNAPNKHKAAGKEPTTSFTITAVDENSLAVDAAKQKAVQSVEADTESAYREAILQFPTSTEKRVVSYGLYGSNPKYTTGAIRNAELVNVWFPGWVARFYCDNTVPPKVIQELKKNGAEIITINDIKGGIAGMFWRFLVADDPTVDRYIIRDTDSRLNPRERFAVEDWIRSGKAVHSIRDHPNHERPLNGGLWGGTKGAVKGITGMVKSFSNKGKYGGDLTFLNEKVWPQIKDNQISHDAYSCKKFPNAHPFPTKRPSNYQHVGQVFFEDEKFRAGDINGFMRGREVPQQCRKKPEWKYG